MKKSKKIIILLAVIVVFVALVVAIGCSIVSSKITLSKVGSELTEANCKTVMIADDVYEFPFYVEELLNNGWKFDESEGNVGAASIVEPRTKTRTLSLVKHNKNMKIVAYNPSDETLSINDCFASELIFEDSYRTKVVLPGNYQLGGLFPAEYYQSYFTGDYNDQKTTYQKYEIPFVGAGEHECLLYITYNANLKRTSKFSYCMDDIVLEEKDEYVAYNINDVVSNLDWNLNVLFHGDDTKYSAEEMMSWGFIWNKSTEDRNEDVILESLIYLSGFDDRYIKDTNGDFALFVENVENNVEWEVYKVDEDTVGIKYKAPDSVDKMRYALDTVLDGYEGRDYAKDQELFDAYAKNLSQAGNYEMNEGSIEVDVYKGGISADDYTKIYLTLFGLGELFEE